MHRKQVLILKRLEKLNGLRFADLSRGFDIDDKFPYHLKQLLNYGYTYKKDGLYFISKEGMGVSITYDTRTLELLGQVIPLVSIVCDTNDSRVIKQKDFNGELHHMFPRKKILFGQKVEEAVKELIFDEVGLSDVPFKALTTHYRRLYTTSGDLLFDNITTYFKVNIEAYKDNLKLKNNNELIPVDRIAGLSHKWPEIDMIMSEDLHSFEEYDFTCDFNVKI